MKLSRESWLAIGLVVVLAVITALAAAQQTQAAELPPLSSASTAPDGARALWMWLDDLHYAVRDDVTPFFSIPRDARLVLMLEPFPGITSAEWETIDDWVRDGGTLIVAGDQFGAALATQHYTFTLAYLDHPVPALAAQTPLLASPPLTGAADVQTLAYLETGRSDFVAHLATPSGPVVVSFALGKGRVILSAAPYAFSNAGLKEPGNPALVLNLILISPTSGAVWFDEWHHGVRPVDSRVVGPEDWLRRTPAGRALLYVAGVIFLAVLLRGRRFGRPVPLPGEITRRAPLEYISAIANLSRRAGHRRAVLQQYRQRLKRHLGQRYRLDPTLNDAEYVARLAEYNPGLDAEALGRLLARLQRPNVNESEMIQLAAEVAAWMKEQ
jgi:hypothetical protein